MTELPASQEERHTEPARASGKAFFGMGALACVLFLDLGSLVISPWWAAGLLVVVWLVLFRRACRWFTADPGRVSVEAALGFVIWLIVQVAGGLWVW